MARNMKVELHTFSLILYQSKKCGHRIHVLYYSWCMTSTDIVKWRKNEWLWKFWKRNDLYENFEKRGGVVEKRGRRKRNPCPMHLWFTILCFWLYWIWKLFFQPKKLWSTCTSTVQSEIWHKFSKLCCWLLSVSVVQYSIFWNKNIACRVHEIHQSWHDWQNLGRFC